MGARVHWIWTAAVIGAFALGWHASGGATDRRVSAGEGGLAPSLHAAMAQGDRLERIYLLSGLLKDLSEENRLRKAPFLHSASDALHCVWFS